MDIYIEKDIYTRGVKFINSLMDAQLPEFRGPLSKNIEYKFKNEFVYSVEVKEYSMVEFISLLDRLCYKSKGVLTERVKSYLFRVLNSEEMKIVEDYCNIVPMYSDLYSYTEFVNSVSSYADKENDYMGHEMKINSPYSLRKFTLNLFKRVYSSLKSREKLSFYADDFPKLLSACSDNLLLAKSIILTIPTSEQLDSIILELNSDACDEIQFIREGMLYIPSYYQDALSETLLKESMGYLDEMKLIKDFNSILEEYRTNTGTIDDFQVYLNKLLQNSKYSMKEASYIKYLANKELSESYAELVGGF